MWQSAQDAYLESRVLSASPLELVRLLYQAAINAVRDARQHLAAGDIVARSRAINRACQIVFELAGSLDAERGGEISARLADLYDYIGGRLIEANVKQADEPLAEVLGLLATMAEGWQAVAADTKPEEQPDNRWSENVMVEQAPSYASHAWSL
jgi:flagellar protein FliS